MLVPMTACTPADDAPGSGPTASSEVAPLSGRHVSRDQSNRHHHYFWPFTVDAGTLSCFEVQARGTEYAVVFTTSDGVQYALNGVATNTGRFPDPRPILAKSPVTGYWEDASSLIATGHALCPGYRPMKSFRQ